MQGRSGEQGKEGEGGWGALLVAHPWWHSRSRIPAASPGLFPGLSPGVSPGPCSLSRLRSGAASLGSAGSSADKRFPAPASLKCLSRRSLAARSPFLHEGRVFLLLLHKPLPLPVPSLPGS